MKKRILILSVALLLAIISIACSSNSSSYANDVPYAEDSYYDYEGEYAYATEAKTVATSSNGRGTDQDVEPIPQDTGRKLIRDASLTIETKAYEDLMREMDQQISSVGGYVESMNERGNSYKSSSYRTASLTARIPSNQLDAFLNVVDGIGNVTRKTLSTRDVTSAYVDMESRLKVLETEKESLQRIMAEAETTADMLATQSRLYDVIEEIEAYEAQKRTYDSLISYSTVSISIEEVLDLTPAKEETRGEELARRFRTSIEDLGEALVSFGIGFIVALPWLLVIGVIGGGIALAIVLPIRARKKKQQAKKEQK